MKKLTNSTHNASEFIENFEQVLDSLIVEPKLILELDLQCENSPDFTVTVDGQTYYDQCITKDTASINIEHEYQSTECAIKMLLHGKTQNDTVLDEQGNIVLDKHILIKRMVINNFEIYSDNHVEHSFIYDKIKYYDAQGQIIDKGNKMGFWMNNHSLNITYTQPFYKWFLKDNNQATYTRNMDFTRSADSVNTTVEQAAQQAFDSLKLLK